MESSFRLPAAENSPRSPRPSDQSATLGVVIATRDRAETLARTLERLTTLPENPEILVVDNASRDGTAAMVARRFPGVRLLRLAENRGALARNDGVRALRTPYIAFSDDDSWWEPGSLAEAARLLAENPRLGLVAAEVRVGEEREPDPINTALARSPLGPSESGAGTAVLGFLACAAVARRAALVEVGGFHPLLFFGAEETLLAYDLAAGGWGVSYCPGVVAAHHPAVSVRPGRDVLVRRNALLIAWLRRPLPLALRRTAALAAEARRDRDALRALRGALVRLPAALRHRTPLPPRVERAARRVERAEREAPTETVRPRKPERAPEPEAAPTGTGSGRRRRTGRAPGARR